LGTQRGHNNIVQGKIIF